LSPTELALVASGVAPEGAEQHSDAEAVAAKNVTTREDTGVSSACNDVPQ
jgi:hypothetical protein